MKTEYCFRLGNDYLNRQSFHKLLTQHRKNEVLEMIESQNNASRNLEKTLQALEQAKQRVAMEKENRTKGNAKPRSHSPTQRPQRICRPGRLMERC